jgi:putative transposase
VVGTTASHLNAKAIVAGDFCTVILASCRLLSVVVVIERATRRILHATVTVHPTAQWTRQQLREAMPSEHGSQFLMHDRETIFSQDRDQRVRHLGVRILKTPVRSPKANALCERLLGTLRCEGLDFLIPFTENHLRCLLEAWVPHDNEGRPRISWGPGIPQPPSSLPVALQAHWQKIPPDLCVVARPILGGLHHEYRLEKKAA